MTNSNSSRTSSRKEQLEHNCQAAGSRTAIAARLALSTLAAAAAAAVTIVTAAATATSAEIVAAGVTGLLPAVGGMTAGAV
jgi:hypothetical protein